MHDRTTGGSAVLAHAKSWAAQALRDSGIEVLIVDLPRDAWEAISAARLRRRR